MLTDEIILKRLHSTSTRPLQRLLFATLLLNRPLGKPHWVPHLRTLMFIVGARRYWMAVLVRFTPQKLHSPSTMPKFVIITAGAPQRDSCYRSKSALPG